MIKIDDLKYLCTNLGNLSGIPVRIYKDNELIFYYSLAKLLKDSFEVSKEAAFKLKDDIAYPLIDIDSIFQKVFCLPD